MTDEQKIHESLDNARDGGHDPYEIEIYPSVAACWPDKMDQIYAQNALSLMECDSGAEGMAPEDVLEHVKSWFTVYVPVGQS